MADVVAFVEHLFLQEGRQHDEIPSSERDVVSLAFLPAPHPRLAVENKGYLRGSASGSGCLVASTGSTS